MSNAARLIQQLKETIQKDYGLDAYIDIRIHSHNNPALSNRDVALQITLAITQGLDAKITPFTSQQYKWFTAECENTRIQVSTWYERKEV